MTFTYRPIKVKDCEMMWKNLADDVREEFHEEGITNFYEFRRDVLSGDHGEIFFDEDGGYIGAIWAADGDGERTFGCCVNKPEQLKSRLSFARISKDILADFATRESDDVKELVVYIPLGTTRCIRHARRFCGLEWVGIETFGDLECHRFVFKRGGET